MNLLIKLSLRYLLSVSGSALIISLIAFVGISLSVSAVLLTMGVFSGFQKALKEKILATTPHVIVSLLDSAYLLKEDALKAIPEIKKAEYLVLYSGVISKEGRVQAVSVKGVRNLKEEGILVGEGLADILNISKGQEITLISPLGIRTPLGFAPKVGQFRVAGFIKTGAFQQDYLTVLMSEGEAEKFFGDSWQMKGYEIYLRDPYKAQEVKEKVEKVFSYHAIVRSWIDLNQQLFNALQLEKVAIFFVLLLMTTLSSFNITSLLFLKVRDKVRDIAVLRTYGFKKKDVMLTFLLQGLILGLGGILSGIVLALVGQFLINHYELIRVPAEVYLMDHIPCAIDHRDLAITFFVALFISLLASLAPSYRASKLSVVEILRKD